jgi:hypothetical protein
MHYLGPNALSNLVPYVMIVGVITVITGKGSREFLGGNVASSLG